MTIMTRIYSCDVKENYLFTNSTEMKCQLSATSAMVKHPDQYYQINVF